MNSEEKFEKIGYRLFDETDELLFFYKKDEYKMIRIDKINKTFSCYDFYEYEHPAKEVTVDEIKIILEILED